MLRAFTLIEILVTVSVLAMLAAFAVPTYQLILSQLQLSSAVNEAADFIRQAQQKTVTEQQVYGVRLTVNATSIAQFRVSGSTETTVDTLDLPSSIRISAVSLSGASQVRFTTAGSPSVSGSITLQDTVRNRTRTVELRPSGNIRNQASEQ